MHESPKACFNISKVSLPVLPNLTQNLMHTLCSSTSAIPPISENRRRLVQYTHRHVQQANASTSNHATRHTHSQDTTATHPSGKFVNYKRLACYEHCPGTFGYTFVHITRLASKEIFSPSNKIHREVGRAKDLSAPLYKRSTTAAHFPNTNYYRTFHALWLRYSTVGPTSRVRTYAC